MQGTKEPLELILYYNIVLTIILNYIEVEAYRGVITKYTIPI
jgi:hypothetical protein